MAMYAKPSIAVADSDIPVVRLLEQRLRSWGYKVGGVTNSRTLLHRVGAEMPDLLILEVNFGNVELSDAFRKIRSLYPRLPIAIMASPEQTNLALRIHEAGAFDYLIKPIDLDRLRAIVRHVEYNMELHHRILELETEIGGKDAFDRFVGESKSINKARNQIAALAPTMATVFIAGEAGTGKEHAARALHDRSPQKAGPFVPLNLSVFAKQQHEAMLFGQSSSSSRGGMGQIGCVAAADGGTLYVDALDQLEPNLQSKLVRACLDGQNQKPGSSKSVPAFRLVLGSHENVTSKDFEGKMKKELLDLIKHNVIQLTPLNDRKEDIPLLAGHFLTIAALRHHKGVCSIGKKAMKWLIDFDWTENVEQLENVIDKIAMSSRADQVDEGDLPSEILAGKDILTLPTTIPNLASDTDANVALKPFELVEKAAIIEALNKSHGHVRDASRILGYGMATVYRKIKRFGIREIDPRSGRLRRH